MVLEEVLVHMVLSMVQLVPSLVVVVGHMVEHMGLVEGKVHMVMASC